MKLKIILIISILALCQNAFAGFSDFSFLNWSWGQGHNKHHKDRITGTVLAVFGTLTATHADTAGTLPGQAVTLLPGTLTVYVSNVGGTLAGGSTTASGGTLTPQVSQIMAISGQSVTSSAGILTGSASVAGSQNLAGNYVIASGGILSGVAADNTSPSVLMTGDSVQVATGLFLPTVTQIMAITGDSESVTSSVGALLAAAGTQSALTGNPVTASIGTFTPVAYANIAISGQSVTSQSGTLTGSGNSTANVTLTGQSVTASYPSNWGSTTSVAYGLDTTQTTLTAQAGTLTNSQNVSANLLTGASGFLLLEDSTNLLLQDSTKYLLEAPADSMTASLGTLTATVLQSASSSLTGDSATSSVGTLAGSTVSSVSATLTGDSATSSVGTLAGSTVSSMAAIVQSAWQSDGGTNATTRSVTLNGVQAGNKLIAVVSTNGDNVVDFANAGTGVSDGTAFTLDAYTNNSKSSYYMGGVAFYSRQVGTGGNFTITFTANAGAGLHLAVYEVSGLAASGAFDVTATGTSTNSLTTVTSTFSTASAGLVLMCSMEDNYLSSVTHSFSGGGVVDYEEQDGVNAWSGAAGHLISSGVITSSTFTATMGSMYTYTAVRFSIAAYKAAAAPPPEQYLLLQDNSNYLMEDGTDKILLEQ